jgi:hypothetical protein
VLDGIEKADEFLATGALYAAPEDFAFEDLFDRRARVRSSGTGIRR